MSSYKNRAAPFPASTILVFSENSLDLILSDGSIHPRKGKILLADRQVDPSTGTIRIVAAFPNPGNILRPGQYGRVHVETNMKKGALLIPQSAVAQSQGTIRWRLLAVITKSLCAP